MLFGVVYDTTQLDKTQHKIKLDKSFMIFKKNYNLCHVIYGTTTHLDSLLAKGLEVGLPPHIKCVVTFTRILEITKLKF